MAKAIGPTFHRELIAAGVPSFKGSWSANGDLHIDPSEPPARRAAILAVYDAHDPQAQLPPPEPALDVDDVLDLLRAKGVLTKAEIDAKKAAKPR